ncbi:MAG: type II toxin-antitoxin system HipA family toxin [Maricaulis sp.]|nr:type II toxin-antitoxin system HipA family toxin [Maricaulis sp.]
MSAKPGLAVWWDGMEVGVLRVDQSGQTSFSYLAEWLQRDDASPISFALPLRTEPFSHRECRPFFDGLLPEAEQREIIASVLGVSQANHYKLLEALGGEIAGALTLWPEGETPPSPRNSETDPETLSSKELIDILDRLPVTPMLAGQDGLRLSLAGAQSKLPVIKTTDGIALPAAGQPTTHILKPPIARFEHTTENEAFAMRLAAKIGLPVAPVEIARAEDRAFLLVERYDRVRSDDGHWQRIHQEDFCQALGCLPERKYASEGGPVFRDCFQLLRSVTTRPAREVLKLLDAAIFNLIIGNADAHEKNYSLIYRDRETTMAPLYDLLSTVAYPELAPNLAMKIAKRGRLEEIEKRNWSDFAADIGMSEPFIRRRVGDLCELVTERVGQTAGSLQTAKTNGEAIDRFAEFVDDRAVRLKLKI